MVFRHQNYREFLGEVLSSRVKENPAYSLRLFAMELGLSPSNVSEILSGKKNLSFGRALEVARRLGLSNRESDFFCALTQLARVKRPEAKEQLLKRVSEIHPKTKVTDLSVDIFAAISEWYHIPILVLADLENFTFTPSNVAQKLGIKKLQARVAIERLVRLELLEKVSERKYRRAHEHILFQSEEINRALQHFHKQMFSKAAEAIMVQSNLEKIIETRTVAIDKSQLPEIKKKVQDFLSDLIAFIGKGKIKTEVYHLSMCAFNLKGEKK